MVSPLAAIAIERKAFEDRLAHQAQHDPLTGLPNRVLFVEFLGQALARCERDGRRRRGAVPRPRPLQERERQPRPRRRRRAAASSSRRALEARRCARATRSPASAATSSPCCATTSRSTTPRAQAIDIAGGCSRSIEAPIQLDGEDQHLGASIGIALAGPGDSPEDAAPRRRRRDVPGEGSAARRRSRCSTTRCARSCTLAARDRERDCTARSSATSSGSSSSRSSSSPTGAASAPRRCVRWQHPERGLVDARTRSSTLAEETGLIVPIGAVGARGGVPPARASGERAGSVSARRSRWR